MAKVEQDIEVEIDIPKSLKFKKPIGKIITRKPVVASDEELELNPRARSAKLRVFEKY